MKEAAEKILIEARKYAESLCNVRKRASWSDYERFKTMLHSADCYGYEGQLAQILKL